jgi:ABC-type branched-subunit amino acid transport system substrate-binding protein
MKNNKILWLVLIVIILIVGVTFLYNKPSQSTIKIGALYALSGPAAKFGEISAQGVRDAIRYFEEKTGIKAELIIEDTANDPKVGVSAATKLIDVDKVKFVVVGTSGITNAVAPIAEKSKVILITDAAGYGLTKDKTYLFQNLVPSLNNVTKQVNDNIEWKRVAIVNINDEFGNIWKSEWQKGIQSDRVVETFSFEKTATDYKTDALKIKTFKPDVIVILGYGPALNQVFADLSIQGVKVPYLTYLACTFPGVIGDNRFDLNGNYSYEYPEYQNTEIKAWVTKNGGVNSTFYGLAYENTLTALYAMKTTDNNPEEALTYLKTTKTAGVYGDILFNQNNVVERDLVLTKIENGVCVR